MNKIRKVSVLFFSLILVLSGCISSAPDENKKNQKKIVYVEEDEIIYHYNTDKQNPDNSTNSDGSNNTGNNTDASEDFKPISTGQWKQDRFYLAAAVSPVTYEGIKLYKEVGYNLTSFGFTYGNDELMNGARNLNKVGGVYLLVKNGFLFTGGKVPVTEKSIRNMIYDYNEAVPDGWIIGYDIWDEPILSEDFFTKSYNMMNLIDKYDPNSLKWFNLLPSYGVYDWSENEVDNAFGETGYEAYVEEFVQKIKPQVLSLDYYPYLVSQAGETGDWFRDMGLFRKVSLKYNTPFWYYYQITSINNEPKPTNDEIRYQMYVGLAYGAKCLYGWVCDSVNDAGEKSATFNETKLRNAEIMPLGEYLLDKTTTEIYHTGAAAAPNYVKNFYLDDLSKSQLIDSAPESLIISVFEDGNTDTKYMLVVNKNTSNGVHGKLNLKVDKNISKFNKVANSEDFIGNGKSIDLDINAGGGELYILK